MREYAPQLSANNIVEEVYGRECELEEMWRSLRLAEGVRFPAISHLPSRTANLDLPHKNRNRSGGVVGAVESFVSMRLSDLTGIALPLPLTTVLDTMKRDFEHSVNTIRSVTTAHGHCSGKKLNDSKKKSVPG